MSKIHLTCAKLSPVGTPWLVSATAPPSPADHRARRSLQNHRAASPDEEVAADRVEATIGVDPRAGTETLDQLEAARGPATMLMATAWLGATTGLSSKRNRTS